MTAPDALKATLIPTAIYIASLPFAALAVGWLFVTLGPAGTAVALALACAVLVAVWVAVHVERGS